MKKLMGLFGGVLLIFSFLGIANATTFTLDNFDVTLNSSDPGLVVNYSRIQTKPFSFDLNVTDSITFDLFTIWTNETFVNPDDKVNKPINVSMIFTSPPPPFGGSIDGKTFGVSGWWLFFNYQYGEVKWDGPQILHFGNNNTGELIISLSDEIFNYGLYGLSEGPCWGANVEATITYAKATVPEPGILILLGISMMSLVGLRRRWKD